MNTRKKVLWFEPLFFLFFGVMHMSRVWAFLDRHAYADFWLTLMYGKGVAYYILMGLMATLCILGIIVFIINRKHSYWWRWVYIAGGGYVLFDLFAIATELAFWENLILFMFDVNSGVWYPLWGFFTLLGMFSLALGIHMLKIFLHQK